MHVDETREYLEYWNTGILEYWNTGILEYWVIKIC